MHSDDFLAQQVMKANNPASARHARDRHAVRSLFGTLWRGIRHVAAGIDAFSSVWHGIEVAADHESRYRPASFRRAPVDGATSTPGSGRPAMPCGPDVN
ncbi:hypothetical protein [Ruania alba]|uniref:Uncharacterized protein n=1 Tax=Ruania alba TaxID=648782 RepID=A0A1H5LH55_9MICO|nr:hypothetical protein [Ruania alba]SEE76366.1 hypothetical protein SAMN04488554_2810 [Ruania alba]